MAQCRASFCPDDDLPDEYVFCFCHWEQLPQGHKDSLCNAYGTEEWPIALDECVMALRRIEGYLPGKKGRKK